MSNFKQLREKLVRQQYRTKTVFQEGDYIMSAITGQKGKIHRSGVNYVIAITEDGNMFRAWVKDIREINIQESINNERNKNSIFTDGKTQNDD